MSNDIIIEQLDNSNVDSWDEYVTNHTNSSFYHFAKWKQLLEKTFSHDCIYLLARYSNGDVCGLLPAVNLSSYIFGNFIVSMPFFNYGGALADNEAVKLELESALQKEAELRKVSHIQYRESKERNNTELKPSLDKVNMVLTLPGTPEALGKLIGSKRRSQIKRPIREGVSHEIGGEELLNDFYRVFSENMRDLGTPVYSKSFFKQILETFKESTQICVVYWQGKPVSAGFLIRHKDRLEIPWASTLSYANRISVNMYLYWQIISYAIESKCKEFDFGRSTVDAGTYKFKKQWGAEPQQCYWYYWSPKNGVVPNLSPSNSKFDLAIRMWKKLPLSVANNIGPYLVKNLP